MILVLGRETLLNTEFLGMFMINFHARFHMQNSSHLLVIAIVLKVKHRFHAAAILFPHRKQTP
jgi:hypothetical protein